jgi:hypothetical protein
MTYEAVYLDDAYEPGYMTAGIRDGRSGLGSLSASILDMLVPSSNVHGDRDLERPRDGGRSRVDEHGDESGSTWLIVTIGDAIVAPDCTQRIADRRSLLSARCIARPVLLQDPCCARRNVANIRSAYTVVSELA